MLWDTERAELIVDTAPQAPVPDMRHTKLKESGYEQRVEGSLGSPVIIWWKHGERIGGTTLAMQHRDNLLADVEEAIAILHAEGYRVARAHSMGDPRTAPRLVLAAIVLAFALGWYFGVPA